eukprot:scaffold22058_cov124-Isochrysis_galbana.AAC.6
MLISQAACSTSSPVQLTRGCVLLHPRPARSDCAYPASPRLSRLAPSVPRARLIHRNPRISPPLPRRPA